MMKEKKSPYVLDGNKVAVRDAAGDILEMVENVLDRYGIHVPDEDQTLDENNACLYGMTYSLLMDSIASVVADIVKDVNPEYTIEDCFAGKMGNQEEYFPIGRLQLVSGEFTQMLTISTMHISPKIVDLLDQTCDLVSKNPFPPKCLHCGKEIEVTNNLPPVFEKDGYGWFIFVDPDTMNDKIPADLYQAMEYTAEQGCTWLCLDADAEPIPGLPTYERKDGGEDHE